MNGDFNSNEGLRSQIRAKRRKTNLVLNGLIGLVVILIVIVSIAIFGDDEEKNNNAEVDKQTTETAGTATGEDKPAATKKVDEKPANTDKKDDAEKAKSDENEAEADKANKDDEVVQEGGSDANVIRTITNPSWKPIGTTQSGPYANSSVDWDERERAMAYALGIDKGNMINWYLGRAGANQSIGTASVRGNDQAYRIYLEWVEGQGWKPTKVEELKSNDKKRQ